MTTFRLFEGIKDNDIDLVTNVYTMYLEEIFKENFIGTYDTVKRMLEDKTDTLFLVYTNKVLVGFIDVTYNNLYDNIKPYIDVEQMYILPEFRSKMTVGNMFSLICLISRANGNIPILGNTLMSSSNISNNIKAGGVQYSQTFMFNPIENKKSRRFYDRAIKLWERNNNND